MLDGATVTAFNAFVVDQSDVSGLDVGLRASPSTTAANATTIGQVQSSGNSPAQQALRATSIGESFAQVDTALVSYTATTCLHANIRFNGAMIELSY